MAQAIYSMGEERKEEEVEAVPHNIDGPIINPKPFPLKTVAMGRPPSESQ